MIHSANQILPVIVRVGDLPQSVGQLNKTLSSKKQLGAVLNERRQEAS
jgi:hypothetical protein